MKAGARGLELPPLAASHVRLRVIRRDGPTGTPRTEHFDLERRPTMTVADALDAIAARPITSAGVEGSPVAWGPRCDSGACGACTLLVDGKPRPACTTVLVASPAGLVTLAPLEKLPVVRDLVADRAPLLRDLARMGAELPRRGGDGAEARSTAEAATAANAIAPDIAALARCTGCGACLEACPEYGPDRAFVGAAVLGQAERLRRLAAEPADRLRHLEAVMTAGGLSDCGKAEACIEVCPVGVPLVEAIRSLNRAATLRLFAGWMRGRRSP